MSHPLEEQETLVELKKCIQILFFLFGNKLELYKGFEQIRS